MITWMSSGDKDSIELLQGTLDWGINSRMTVVATACVALFIIAVATISSIWPVRRALKIQPSEALRTT